MPEGYRLLSLEERKALPEDEMRAIGASNTALLKEAVRSMTPAQRQELGVRLGQFGQTHELQSYERQYVTMVSMMLLAAGQEELASADRTAGESRFQALLREQETETKGFPGDQKSVTAEADAIEAELGTSDPRALYLRALKPLRARPWNEAIRVCFRRVVRRDPYPRQQKTSLYDAALVFLQAREKESPNEGAWYSLEAFLRLSMRNEVADAKRLFAIAIQKNANDTESRIFPILLAEVDGDQKEVERLLPRAREAWPKPEDLDRILWSDIDALPTELQPRAREAVGGKYKKAHPADWSSRAEILSAGLVKGNFREVETETATLLALPTAILPEPHRCEFLALQLRALAGLGRCDEAVAELPSFEAAVRAVYPAGFDGSVPPQARTVRDVQALRPTLEEGRRALRKLQASIADGSLESAPEWQDVPREQRITQAKEWAAELQGELKEMESLLADPDDAAVAVQWTRREHEAWQQLRQVPDNAIFDEADRGTRLTILVRSAAGKCLLAQHRAAEAARVLAPCVGNGANYHGDCGEPILEAGRELVKQGKVKDAAAVYAVTAPVENFSSRAGDLYLEIEKAAPGTVPRFQPTPKPTPRVPVTPLGIP